MKMYERLVEMYREVNTPLCFMDRNDLYLSAAEIDTMSDAMVLLKPFEEVTRELSADKFVSKFVFLLHAHYSESQQHPLHLVF